MVTTFTLKQLADDRKQKFDLIVEKTFAISSKKNRQDSSVYIKFPTILNENIPVNYRSVFDRDRDQIINSRYFKRLNGKSQVFLPQFSDYVRTRLTHSMEVNNIARLLAKAMGLNLSLVEAIALGHDIGHTPFGHAGEYELSRIMNGCSSSIANFNNEEEYGFKHNFQAFYVLSGLEGNSDLATTLETDFAIDPITLWGIVNHTKLRINKCPYYREDGSQCHYSKSPNNECKKDGKLSLKFYQPFYQSIIDKHVPWSFEAVVVNYADEIAQIHHDFEDSVITGFFSPSDVIQLFNAFTSRNTEFGFTEAEIIELINTSPIYKTNGKLKEQKKKDYLTLLIGFNQYKAVYGEKHHLEYFRFLVRANENLNKLLVELNEHEDRIGILKTDRAVWNLAISYFEKSLDLQDINLLKKINENPAYWNIDNLLDLKMKYDILMEMLTDFEKTYQKLYVSYIDLLSVQERSTYDNFLKEMNATNSLDEFLILASKFLIDIITNDLINTAIQNFYAFSQETGITDRDAFMEAYLEDNQVLFTKIFGKDTSNITSNGIIHFSDMMERRMETLRDSFYNVVIHSKTVQHFNTIGENVIHDLFCAYYSNPRLLPDGTLFRIFSKLAHIKENHQEVIQKLMPLYEKVTKEKDKEEYSSMKKKFIGHFRTEIHHVKSWNVYKNILIRCICNYIAGMTDAYAFAQHKEIFGSSYRFELTKFL